MSNQHGDSFGSSDESASIELAMLYDDISSLFTQHLGMVAILMSDSLDEPTDLILAGSYNYSDSELADISIQQRIVDNEINYLIIHQKKTPDRTSYYSLVNPTSIQEVTRRGLYLLETRHIEAVRYTIRSGVAQWDLKQAEQLAEERKKCSPFMWVSRLK